MADFKKDLIIAADDGKVYFVSEESYKQEELTDPVRLAEAKALLQRGCVLAAVPNSDGTGAYCYLVNLSSLKDATPFEPEE